MALVALIFIHSTKVKGTKNRKAQNTSADASKISDVWFEVAEESTDGFSKKVEGNQVSGQGKPTKLEFFSRVSDLLCICDLVHAS